jgi:hypothetical protein
MAHATLDRSVALIVTDAPFTYVTPFPACCDPARYHVFRWHGGPIAPPGLTCQCGARTGSPNVYIEELDGPPWVSA